MEKNKVNKKPSVRVTPTPTPTPTPEIEAEQIYTKNEEYHKWILENRAEFFNYNKKSKEFRDKVYEIYNYLYNDRKVSNNCGGCDFRIYKLIKKYYEL